MGASSDDECCKESGVGQTLQPEATGGGGGGGSHWCCGGRRRERERERERDRDDAICFIVNSIAKSAALSRQTCVAIMADTGQSWVKVV